MSEKILVLKSGPKMLSANQSWVFLNLQDLLICSISDFDILDVVRISIKETSRTYHFGMGMPSANRIGVIFKSLIFIYLDKLDIWLIFKVKIDINERNNQSTLFLNGHAQAWPQPIRFNYCLISSISWLDW